MSATALPRCARLGLDIPLQPLLSALAAVDEPAWQRHFNSGFYTGDWSGVALITPEDAPLPLAPGQGAPLASDLLRRSAVWQAALGAFRTTIRSARLLRLGAGSRIHEHCDPDLGLPDSDLRLHLPLLSADGVEFLVAPASAGSSISRDPTGWTTPVPANAFTWCWIANAMTGCWRSSRRGWWTRRASPPGGRCWHSRASASRWRGSWNSPRRCTR